MLEICQKILQLYRDYIGSGMVGALFLTAVFYLLFEEKEQFKKRMLAVVPLILMMLFACPVFAWVVYRYLDEEIYYRFLWLLPVTLVIAYAGVKLVLKLQGVQRLLALLCLCSVIMVCGDYVYDNPYFTRAENPYHVPQTVAEICDEILVPGREVKAVFPAEMLQYVRQYTPYICMPYGREMIVEQWRTYNAMFEAYELGVLNGPIEAEHLAKTARENAVHYIIWDSRRTMEGSLEEYSFSLQEEIDGYEIYLDDKAYLGL